MILQSGVIPYRLQADSVEVLLVSSSSGKRWGIPKGWIEPGLSSAESAVKEAWEEAGVRGTVQLDAIGHYETRKFGFIFRVEVFLMCVEQEEEIYPEATIRKRQWVSVNKAIKLVHKSKLKQLLQQTLIQLDLVSDSSLIISY
ncbi:MAG: NUDIX hydrolase [Leptolyngbyaceae cyanobacterium bins.302]|nr:NUDIX hydrolase [Leptolyngbyaceae cyanobacterium bins.302]